MENLFYNISQVLGITILHSLWQGLIIYMVLSLVLQFLVDKPAALKYKIAFTALTIILGWFIITLYMEVSNYASLVVIPSHIPPPTTSATDFVPVDVDQLAAPPIPIDRYYFLIAGYLPYITMLYMVGLVFNTLKILLSWNTIYRIRQNITDTGLQAQVSKLAQQTGLAKFVKVAFSQMIDVPCITGFIKPIILLPFGISTYLTAEEIKAILLHELAHIKRNDYLISLIQQAIGIVLFFNPFARLINKIINTERENSCDDMVVRTTNTPLVYAQALLKLEQNKQQEWHLALAATGKTKYHLLQRIERIMKTKKTTVNIRPALIALVLLTCSLSSIAWFNPKIEEGKISVKAVKMPLSPDIYADTLKSARKVAKPAAKAKAPSAKKASGKMAFAYDYEDDAKMKQLSEEIEKHAAVIEKYYSSPEFTKMQADMEKKGSEMEAFYNDPKLKQIQEDMEKKSAEFEKLNDNPDIKKLQAELEANGKSIEKYYSSPEFTKRQKQLAEESALLAKSTEGSADFKKHMEEIKKLSSSFKDYANNPAIKERMELSKKLSSQMHDYYKSPEYTKQREEIRAIGDSMRKAYQNPKMKEQQEEMRKIGKEMREYQNKPEIMQEKKKLKEAEQKIREYQKSPEFKQKHKEDFKSMKMNLKMDMKMDRNGDKDDEFAAVSDRKESADRVTLEINDGAVVAKRTKVADGVTLADTLTIGGPAPAHMKVRLPAPPRVSPTPKAPKTVPVKPANAASVN